MATHEEIRQIAMKLPGVHEGGDRFGFGVTVKGKQKGVCWSWLEKVHPKKARVVNDGVLAVRVRNLSEKEMILESDSQKFFTEDHYNGYPAVLVRLDAITADELEDLLIEGWKSLAPKDSLAAYEATQSDGG